MIRHTMILVGGTASGKAAVSAHVLRALLDAVDNASQRALRLRVQGRSNLHGKPSWLDAATNYELVAKREGSSVLECQAPTLQEAAPALFQQLAFPDLGPRPDQSVLSLVAETLREATTGNEESELLDRGTLDAVARFSRVFGHDVYGLILNGSEPQVHVTPAGIETAGRLRRETPRPQRAVVAGVLDELAGSKRAFNLLLASGHSMRGLLPPGDPRAYRDLFGEKVVVDAEVSFRPSGAVSILSATHIRAASQGDDTWERLPRPSPMAVDDIKPPHPPPSGLNGMARVFGKWPGTETDEEILAALERSS